MCYSLRNCKILKSQQVSNTPSLYIIYNAKAAGQSVFMQQVHLCPQAIQIKHRQSNNVTSSRCLTAVGQSGSAFLFSDFFFSE